MVMTHTKTQGQSVQNIVETNGETDAIDCFTFSVNAADNKAITIRLFDMNANR